MSTPLGLSVGAINLVAAHAGSTPLTRRAVLTLPTDGTPEFVAPGTPGSVRGFVERVGYPAPLTAGDGSTHQCADLTATALVTLAGLVGYGSPVTVAVPAHWGPGPLTALRTALNAHPDLAADGIPPTVVSDAAAALAALDTRLPRTGVVALCDFGGSGTGITLVDAAAGCTPIGPTLRYGGFSGEQVDQAVLTYLLGRLRDSHGVEPGGDTAIAALAQLREACRTAKERLSGQAVTTVAVDLPGFTGELPLTRTELSTVLAVPVDGVVDAVSDTLARRGVATGRLTAVAIVGGGAAIPAVGEQLGRRLQVPVIAAADPGCTAAAGAALLSTRSGASAIAHPELGTGPLAWSQDDSASGEPLPYSESDYAFAGSHSHISAAAPVAAPATRPAPAVPPVPEPTRSLRRPALLATAGGLLAAALTLIVLWALARTSGPGQTAVPTAPTTAVSTDVSTDVSTVAPSPAAPSAPASPTPTTPHRQHRSGR